MPATYDADQGDQRHKGFNGPSKVKKPMPPVKKDPLDASAKRTSNSGAEKQRLKYSVC